MTSGGEVYGGPAKGKTLPTSFGRYAPGKALLASSPILAVSRGDVIGMSDLMSRS